MRPDLAEFARQGKEQAALVEKMLADTELMKQMLVADGAKPNAVSCAGDDSNLAGEFTHKRLYCDGKLVMAESCQSG